MKRAGTRGRKAVRVTVALAVATACDSGEVVGPPGGAVRSVAVAPREALLTHIGDTVRFAAAVRRDSGSAAAGAVRWESADESVVTVDGTGLATARGNGRAEVRATLEGVAGAAAVTVEQRPAALVAFGGGQRALAGLRLPASVGVTVRDAGGRPVAGVSVRFAVASGGGSVDPDTAVSDETGAAAAEWTLGAEPGEQRMAASVPGGPEAAVTATAVDDPSLLVAWIEASSGAGQSYWAGRRLLRPVVVGARDAGGRPVPGALVRFEPARGGGSADPDSARTDSLGLVAADWTLGAEPGEQRMVASVRGGPEATLTATARDPSPLVAEIVALTGDGQRRSVGSRAPVVVRALDARGRPVPAALVRFAAAGGGSADPDSARTDESGEAATAWTLGAEPGGQRMIASVPDGPDVSLTATALHPDSAVAGIAPWSGGGQWGLAGSPLQEPVVVRALDAGDRPVPGALVRFEPAPGAGSADPDSARTDSLGLAATAWTLGASPGGQALRASAGSGRSLEVAATAHRGGGVCDRTRAVAEELVRQTGAAHCSDVTAEELASVGRVFIDGKGIAKLRSGDFAGLSRLHFLDLADNLLASLPPGLFAGLDSLRRLELNHNRLESLPPGTFSDIPGLTWLGLRVNRLTEIPSGLGTLSRLGYLDLTFNPLGEIPPDLFARMPDMGTLLLQSMGLRELPPELFGGLSRLRELRLTGNELEALPAGVFDDLSSLELLTLSENQLTELPPGVFARLRSLEALFVRENALARLDADIFAGTSGLRNLSLDRNRLRELPPAAFGGLSRLSRLSLADNALAGLPPGIFAGLGTLRELRLEGNALAALPPGAFAGLSALEVLRLERNALAALPDGVFDGLRSLRELRLEGNALTALPPGVFAGLSSLEEMVLYANPGEPFPVPLELARIDAADALAPGPARVALRVPSGAPAPFRARVAVNGGAASGAEFAVSAGDTVSAPLVVSRSSGSSGATHVGLGQLPGFPTSWAVALEAVRGEPLTLFAPSDNLPPAATEGIPAHRLTAGGRSATVGLGARFADPDGDALTFGARSDDAGVVAARVEGGALVLEPASEGAAVVEVSARDPDGLVARLRVPVAVGPAPDPDGFRIAIEFVEGAGEGERFTEAERAVVRRAAARWEEVVTGDLPDVPVDGSWCGEPARRVGTVDDVVVRVSISDEGRNRILASAGRCATRESYLTVIGRFRFNRHYFGPDAPEAGRNSMYEVALHEIGHVLGIGGTAWSRVLRERSSRSVGVRDTHFPGSRAVEAFNEAGGWAYRGGKVPTDNSVLLIYRDYHWRRSVLGGELMSIDGSDSRSLSAITAGALADLGYEVDMSAVDPYALPAAADAAVAADADAPPPLADDVVEGPVTVLDGNGRVVRVIGGN